MRHIFESLLERSYHDPNGVFCVLVKSSKEESVSVGSIVESAASIGFQLSNFIIDKDSVVLIILEHSMYLYSSFIGISLAGAIPSFMPPLTRKQDPIVYHTSLEALINRINPAAIISSEKVFNSIPSTQIPILLIDHLPACNQTMVETQRLKSESLCGTDIAFLQHSSGTTGLKKGVMISHNAAIKQCRLYAKNIGFDSSNTIVSWLPLYHDMGLIACFLLPALLGAKVISLDALEWVMRPTTLLQQVEKHGGQYVWLPNFAFQHIVRLDNGGKRWDLSSIKAIISCSEPCRAATFEIFSNKYRDSNLRSDALQVSYALAENVFAVTHTPYGTIPNQGSLDRTKSFVSCGSPLEETLLQIRDKNGDQLNEWQVGEIWLKSSCLFDGYHKQPELTATKIIDGWYRTGDLGSIESGQLFVIGRVDDLLIINGKNLMAHEVEDTISEIEGVIPGRVLVFSEYDDATGTNLLVVLVETSADITRRGELEFIIRSSIFSSTGVHPSKIDFVESGFLIKSTSGKISRTASENKYRGKI